ncbi:MAG: 3-isopropylmalate dehydratase small subunit [Deltaproteobacteria bacterium]|nr:3-isopropylmalate dehydratase small subunit [Deltaproteobacteria bacterium]MBW1928186.1 3-isopropylmalate dehydratase small subunit [Deltaproteobacteria bacterium]MBW2025429.1 3-isopropylmalate dehydratase small subunit [Deltaproteobacteria bacterium]MBW2126408.1 3-isopropylmalate dehydratase small subunit [Deltaproteobacteria bacterium]RLB16165.1 MAG: 3-isopropylmalate dehydratase small subunit [Deltaproteobacteria bacterium]
MIIKGRVWKFGDHIDTDLIIPARFLNTSDPEQFARHCFADARPDFASHVKEGDIIVAGVNFGCGSSREHAPLALKAVGIRAVVAKSFARIFYRNAFNIGLPLLECPEAYEQLEEGMHINLDLVRGLIESEDGQTLTVEPIPEFMRKLIEAGGLLQYVKGVKGS